MNLNIFSNKVNELIAEFNQMQKESEGSNSAVKENFNLFRTKAENLIKEFQQDQKNISQIMPDYRKAQYMLTGFISKLKEKKETEITKLFTADPFGGTN